MSYPHINIICTSNRPYPQLCEQLGHELLERMHYIAVPALKERRLDIPLLAQRIARQRYHDQRKTGVISPHELVFTKQALARLKGSDAKGPQWAGNVRELKNVIHRAANLASRSGTAAPRNRLRIGVPDVQRAIEESVARRGQYR